MVAETEIGSLLLEQGLTLATAESCTGGLVSHRLTNVPGSSDYYLGGIVAYSNEAKEALLSVRPETLQQQGAVSEATAREMARGARLSLGAGVGISVTGIAGPGGGTPEKPVGLVYIGLSAEDIELCSTHTWEGDRLANKEQSAEAALLLLLSYLRGRPRQDRAQAEDQEEYSPGADLSLRAEPSAPLLQFVNEPVAVQMRSGPGGALVPLAFDWQGRHLEIRAWGRETQTTRAGRALRCFLVQTAGPESWELCLETQTAQWWLTRHWAGRSRGA